MDLTEDVDISDVLNIAKTLFGDRSRNLREMRPSKTEKPQVHPIRLIEFEETPSFYEDHDHEWISLMDEKDGPKYIMKQIEPLVRSAPQYKEYAKRLRWEEKLYHCAIYPQLRHRYDCIVDLHHYPLTLYDICFTIARKIASDDGDINYFNTIHDYELIKEVLRIHTNDQVSFVPLSVTPHDLHHEGLVFIPLDKVSNKWESFVNEFASYMEQWMLDKINKFRNTTEKMRKAGDDDIPVIMEPYITMVRIGDREYPFVLPS